MLSSFDSVRYLATRLFPTPSTACPALASKRTSASVSKTLASPSPFPALLQPLCHPLAESVSREVDAYFLQHFGFGSEKARKKFVDADISGLCCYMMPKARDDRIHLTCKLFVLLFIVDDHHDHACFDEIKAYNERLMAIICGDVLPDRSIPMESLTYDVWQDMRKVDEELANGIMEPTFMSFRAQMDENRTSKPDLGSYLIYRHTDIGSEFLFACIRFSMGLHIEPAELASMKELEDNCASHISVVNDICSYAKEIKTAQSGHEQGGALCSAVRVLAQEALLDDESAKRVLWYVCREWERRHLDMTAKRRQSMAGLNANPDIGLYLQALEYPMAGGEVWCQTTKRYTEISG